MKTKNKSAKRTNLECIKGAEHTPTPQGYIEMHAWADKKLKTHINTQCPGCGLWAVWVKKK